jgi:(S)-ureidoglycine aminohydrolase
MQQLGFTRTSVKPDHALLTPDSFIRAAFPGDENATRVVHINPPIGAAFAMYTVEAAKNAKIAPALEGNSCFLFVVEGQLELTLGKKTHSLTGNHYAFIPADARYSLTSKKGGRATVFEKPYHQLEGVGAPKAFVADASRVVKNALNDDPALQVQVLLPAQIGFDFAVNIMNFEPGAHLHLVETHVMEHGLLMLSGGGIYRLGDAFYPVTAGDVIYMAPYCPQWFGALGKTSSSYLLYKDWNRHPLE